jgi:hypothetical protein
MGYNIAGIWDKTRRFNGYVSMFYRIFDANLILFFNTMRYFFALPLAALFSLLLSCETRNTTSHTPTETLPQTSTTSNPSNNTNTPNTNTQTTDTAKTENGAANPNVGTSSNPSSPAPSGVLSAAEAQKAVATTAQNIVNAIATHDYKTLSGYVSAQKGLHFTPYTHIAASDLLLTTQQIANAAQDSKTYHWGEQDGSGEPIELTIPAYFKRYVYNYDYAKKGKISYNQPIGKGNSINNHREKYPKGIVVEYHIAQNDPQYNGMDWGSLYLIFDHNGNNWELVRIVHGQWTS